MSAFHVEYSPNETGRDFIVGDIHGHFDLLINELGKHKFDAEAGDRCFSVGDLIDRGPRSADTLMLAKEDWFIPVRGNHEQMMLESIFERRMDLWFANGGDWFKDSDRDKWEEYVRVAFVMPYAITLQHASGAIIGICHAEPPFSDWNATPEAENNPNAANRMIWERMRYQLQDDTPVHNVDLVFCGHTPLRNGIARLGNVVYIDTGAFFTGNLTILCIDDYLKESVNGLEWAL